MIAVDPGIRGCGVAIFNARACALEWAGYIANDKDGKTDGERVLRMARAIYQCDTLIDHTFVVERPQIYPHSPTPNKLMLLAEVGACIAGMLDEPPVQYSPHEWKGSVEPIEMTWRVRERLLEEEFRLVEFPKNSCAMCRKHHFEGDGQCLKPSSCLAHNVLDATGLALYHLGRLNRKRVIHR